VIDARSVVLRRIGPGYVDQLVTAVNASRTELAPWMPWAQTPATVDSITAFVEQAVSGWVAHDQFAYGVFEDDGVGGPDGGREGGGGGDLIGSCGLHNRVGPGVLEIGYWVRTDRTGRGVATALAGALADAARALPGVDEVQIHCDERNVRSAAVPRRLGFHLVRTDDHPPEAPGESGRRQVWSARTVGGTGGP
jgi:RimJ/RimL family protein N-acetyltransferase